MQVLLPHPEISQFQLLLLPWLLHQQHQSQGIYEAQPFSIASRFIVRNPLEIPPPIRAPDAAVSPSSAGAAIPAVRNIKTTTVAMKITDENNNLILALYILFFLLNALTFGLEYSFISRF